jgi:hypothetical protein
MRTTKHTGDPEPVARFNAALAAVKRRRGMVRGRETREFAGELAELLADLAYSDVAGRLGVDLVAAFIRLDRHVFEHCDDSGGYVGDVFRCNARTLFRDFAGRCDDPPYVADLIFDLVANDEYGVRDGLLDDVSAYLPEPLIRGMIARFQAIPAAPDSFEALGKLARVCVLARHIGDLGLFERTVVELFGPDHPAGAAYIAAANLECGNPRAALEQLSRVPEGATFKRLERQELMFTALGQLGMTAAQLELGWNMLREERARSGLDRLLSVLGDENRDAVIAGEAALILAGPGFSFGDLAFLVNLGRFDDAETYLLGRFDQVDGYHYEILAPLADAMCRAGRALGSSLIYRALLASILNRGTYAGYSSGARYLRTLDQLSASVSDWHGLPDHTTWRSALHAAHARKSAFWARYEDMEPGPARH